MFNIFNNLFSTGSDQSEWMLVSIALGQGGMDEAEVICAYFSILINSFQD